MFFDRRRPETVNSCALACRISNHEVLKDLIAKGCGRDGLRSKDNCGWEPIHEACAAGALQCIKILAEEECVDINATTWDRETGLTLICNIDTKQMPHIDCASIAKFLIESGADVDALNDKGQSPLYLAASRLNAELVDILTDAGATVDLTDYNKLSPAHVAIHSAAYQPAAAQSPSTIEINREDKNKAEDDAFKILKKLLECKADLESTDDNDLTLLIYAAERGFLKICKFLLQEKVSLLNMEAIDGATALMLACQNGHLQVVQYLIEQSDRNPNHGIDFNHRTRDGLIALHFAAFAKSFTKEILTLILERTKLDKKQISQNMNWRCPLHIAIENHKYECLPLLIQNLPQESCYESPYENTCEIFQVLGYTLMDPLSAILIQQNQVSNLTDITNLIPRLGYYISSPRKNSIPALVAILRSLIPTSDLNIVTENLTKKEVIIRTLVDCGAKLGSKKEKEIVLSLATKHELFFLFREGVITTKDINHVHQLASKARKHYDKFKPGFGFSEWISAYVHLFKFLGVLEQTTLNAVKSQLGESLKVKEMSFGDIPSSLQALARSEVWKISGMSRKVVEKLDIVPEVIQNYLLFSDIVCDKKFPLIDNHPSQNIPLH